MAFSCTADTPSGVRKGTNSIFGHLALSTGTFTAGGDTKGTLSTTYTGLSRVIACGINVDTGTVTSEVRSKPNVDMDGTAALGAVGILAMATDNVGTWWAIGVP